MSYPTGEMLDELTDQIRAEIGAAVHAVRALAGPSASSLESLVWQRAPMWAGYLLGDDDKLAAQTVVDLMYVRWPDGTNPPARWWSTPLGRAVAASIGYPTAEVVSYSVAGAMLGCTKQNVQQLIGPGPGCRLERGPGGRGVTTESIRARISAELRRGRAES